MSSFRHCIEHRALYTKAARQKYKTQKQFLTHGSPDELPNVTESQETAGPHQPCNKITIALLPFRHCYTCTVFAPAFYLLRVFFIIYFPVFLDPRSLNRTNIALEKTKTGADGILRQIA